MNEIAENFQKRPPRHLFYLGFAALVCGYSIYLFYLMAHLPYTGEYSLVREDASFEVIAVDPGSPADRAGLRKGDKILQMGDQKYYERLKLQPDRSCQVIYQRGASSFITQLTPDQPGFPYNTMSGFMLGVLLLSFGLTVYLKNPLDPAARIFFLLTACFSTQSIIMSSFQVSMTLVGFFFYCIPYFLGPLLLHFFLIFPERKKIVTRHPLLFTLIYGPSFLSFLITFLIFCRIGHNILNGVYDFTVLYHLSWVTRGISLLAVIYVGVVGFLSLAHTFITTHSPETRKQLQWIFLGYSSSSVFAIFGYYPLFESPELVFAGGRPLPLSFFLGFIFFFLSSFFAILKYRLMDIDIVISRSLSYFVMSGITILLYFLLFGFFNRALEFLIGKDRFATYLVAALIVAFLFRPLLIRIQKGIDKLFYREQYELHRALEAVSQALVMVRNPKEIFHKVFQAVDGNLHITSGTLWLQEQRSWLLQQVSSFPEEESRRPISIEPSGLLPRHLSNLRRGLTLYQIRTNRGFEENRTSYMAPFEETNTEIFLPLLYKNTLLGLIGLGKKRSGDLYTSEDVSLLSSLAHHTAVAMENARAYNRIESLNQESERKVEKIEQQQEEILALQQRLLNENICLREEIQQHFDFQEIIGSSKPMKDVLAMVEKIAPTDSTVFLQGESGTGKELIARAIHFNSPRREGPFVRVNCAAIPANLIESEFFGHEKGAFTGAIKAKTGKFELADGGTLFLDEIGELGMDLQVKLLRVLQEKEFERVGGNRTIKADLRIITATNRDIEKAIYSGAFREDLFYRLNVIAITTPPLRDRREDIRALAIHFINKFSREMGKSIGNIDPEVMDALKSYQWPGNIRELANVLERAVVLGAGDTLSVRDLPGIITITPVRKSPPIAGTGALSKEMEWVERQRIQESLVKARGNKSEAARSLGLKRSTFNSKMKKFNMI